MKNHENRPESMENHENPPVTMKNQPQLTFEIGEGVQGRNKQKRYRHFSLVTRGHNWPFRCLDLNI